MSFLHPPASGTNCASLRAMDAVTSTRKLWEHPHPESTRTFQFKSHVERKYHVHLRGYEDLRQWSLRNLSHFWEEVWHFTQMQASQSYIKVPLDQDVPTGSLCLLKPLL